MNFFNICKPDGSQGRSLQWVHGGAKKLQTTCTKSNSLVKVSTNKIHRLYTYIYNIMDPLISLWVKELKTFNYSFKIKRLKRWRSLTDWKRKKPEEKERKAETQRNVSDVERGSGKVRLSNMKRRKSCRWSRQMEGWLLSALLADRSPLRLFLLLAWFLCVVYIYLHAVRRPDTSHLLQPWL